MLFAIWWPVYLVFGIWYIIIGRQIIFLEFVFQFKGLKYYHLGVFSMGAYYCAGCLYMIYFGYLEQM